MFVKTIKVNLLAVEEADGDKILSNSTARDSAALAAIGRAVYGALVEQLLARDGGPDEETYRAQLRTHFARAKAAGRCDLDTAEAFLPDFLYM